MPPTRNDPKRSYGQRCVLAGTADLLGDRWTLLILRELLIRPCRFRDLVRDLEGIGTNLLSARLAALAEAALLERTDEGARAPYRLTERGRALEPALLALIRWGYGHVSFGDGGIHRAHWDLLPLKAFFDPARCERPQIAQFDCDALVAWVHVSPEGLEFGLGPHERAADVHVEIPVPIAELPAYARRRGRRDPDLQTFLACFDLPARPSMLD